MSEKLANWAKDLKVWSSNKSTLPSKKSILQPKTTQSILCNGPVEDLEKMVPNQWWKTVFSDDLYLKTDGDVVEDAEITREEISLLEQNPSVRKVLEMDSDSSLYLILDGPKILDLCCGQGRHSLEIVRKFPLARVHGHDQSAYLISLAKERSSALKTKPHFTVGDCRTIPYPDGHFDLVILMGNSFGYFSEDAQDVHVLTEINRVLAPSGILVLDLTDGDYMRHNFAQRSWEWADKTTFVCRERQLSKDGLRLVSREIITNVNTGVIRDQFYQERLYSRKELRDLLNVQGLLTLPETHNETNVTLSAEMSKRNEDLGMMGNRMFITSMKTADLAYSESSEETLIDAYKTIPKSEEIEELVVIMGDVSKSCVGKLNNTWNEEDIYTRQQLLQALQKSGYSKVVVLENHDQLHQSLTTKRPNFVFNLCDEGWNNEALKELHIPALLESLAIPYSGAGPNCLAFCYDKGLVNRSAEAIGIPTPVELTFLFDSKHNFIKQAHQFARLVQKKMGFPSFVKPMKGDNSIGITKRSIVRSEKELETYMLELESQGIRDVLVQEYLQGTEYGVGVVGNPETGLHFFDIMEVDFSEIIDQNLPPILGYESKWDPDSPYWSNIQYKKAKLPKAVEEVLKSRCVILWERFGCKDYARFDFRCDIGRGDGLDGLNGVIKLLEVNPNPGWCWDGKLAYMAKLGGYEYHDLLNLILAASINRIFAKK
jgi:D-alanine-D-alanine ligase